MIVFGLQDLWLRAGIAMAVASLDTAAPIARLISAHTRARVRACIGASMYSAATSTAVPAPAALVVRTTPDPTRRFALSAEPAACRA